MGTEERDEYAYTGLHAYALVRDLVATGDRSEPNVSSFVDGLREKGGAAGPITSAVELAGPLKALVHLRFPDGDVNALQDHMKDELWNGVDYELAFEGPVYQSASGKLIGMKKHTCDIVAVVRIWVERGRSREVLGRLGDELGDRFHGASIVFGGCDILLALEGPTYEDVAAAALSGLQSIDGIVRTETSFSDYRRVPGNGSKS